MVEVPPNSGEKEKQDATGNIDAKKERQRLSDVAESAFELVKLRNFFYRDNYRRLIAILFFMCILSLLLGYWVSYLITHRPEPRYFATNVQGGITPLYRLDSPGVGTDFVLSWAGRAVSKAFTFNYVEYKGQLEGAAEVYFTANGGQEFIQELENSNDLKAVLAGKFIVTAKPNAAPQLLWQGQLPSGDYQGRYGWQVELPVLLTIQNCTQMVSRYIDVKMTIVRDSYLIDSQAKNMDGAKGIGIAQLLVRGISQST
jgi:intracellular multiplication protein IcmL